MILIYRYTIKFFKLNQNFIKTNYGNKYIINILIYGAGDGGIKLLQSLEKSKYYNVVGFIDDNVGLHKRKIKKKIIYDRTDLKFLRDRYNVK